MLNNKQLGILLWLSGILLFAAQMFPHHFHPYREGVQDVMVALSIFLPIGYLGFQKSVTLSIPSLVILPIILAVFIVLQTAFGLMLYPMDSFFPLIYIVVLTLAMILGATISAQTNGLEKLCAAFAWTYLIVGLISVLFQHVQLVGLDIPSIVMSIHDRAKIRPYANIAQPNLMALVMCFSLASAWWLYQTRSINARTALAAALLLLWGIALTQSRIAWIILPLFVVFCGQRIEGDRGGSRLFLLLLLGVFVCLVLSTPTLLGWAGVPVASVGERAAQTSVRVVLWKQALLISKLHPWVGAGWFQFGHYQVMLATLYAPSEYSEYAHNIILNFAAETGWPMTIGLFGALAFWFYRNCVAQWKDRQVRFISLMFIATTIHSMVEFPLWYGLILFPIGILAGALHRDRMGMKVLQISRFWLLSACAASLVFIAAASVDYYRLMLGYNALVWQQEGKNIGSIEKPEWTMYPQFYDYFKVIKIKIGPGMPTGDIEFLEKASLRFAFTPILDRLALAYALNHRQDEALQVLSTVRSLHMDEYEATYNLWASYAKTDPQIFATIFQHMPKPA